MTMPKGPASPSPVAVKAAPSLLDKCHRFLSPPGIYAELKTSGLYPYFRPIERNDGTRARS